MAAGWTGRNDTLSQLQVTRECVDLGRNGELGQHTLSKLAIVSAWPYTDHDLTCSSRQQTGPSSHLGPQSPTSFCLTSSSGSWARPLSGQGNSPPKIDCFPQCPRIAQRPFSWILVSPCAPTSAGCEARKPNPTSAPTNPNCRILSVRQSDWNIFVPFQVLVRVIESPDEWQRFRYQSLASQTCSCERWRQLYRSQGRARTLQAQGTPTKPSLAQGIVVAGALHIHNLH